MGEVFRALTRRFFVLFLAAVAAFVLVLLAAESGRADPTLASWYGPGFEGRTTSNGEKFDSKEYTAAHRKLPFGTKLLVTYEGRSVVVRINDRGPFSEADLDLSRAAAKHLRMIRVGVAEVEMTTVDPDTPLGPYKGEAEAPSKEPQEKDPEKKDLEKDRTEPEAASSEERKETRDEPEATESQSPPRDEKETRPDDDRDGQEALRDATEAAPPASAERAPQDTPEEATPPATEEDGSADEKAAGNEESSEDKEAAADEAREDRSPDRRDEEVSAARDDDVSPADGDEERDSSRRGEGATDDDDEDRGDAQAPEESREEDPEEADEEAPPPPQRIVVAPEPELVVPGSTVERRLELAAIPEEDQGAQLEPLTISDAEASEKITVAKGSGSSGKGPNGITRLPDTGGAPVSGPALLLVGAALGLLLLRTGR